MTTRRRTLSDCEIQEILADSASESETDIEHNGKEEKNYEDMEIDQPEETIDSSASNRRTTRDQNVTPQIWVSGNFKPHLFHFDRSQCGLTQYLINRQLEIPLD